MKRLPVLHPFLFALVPVLYLFSSNSRTLYVSPSELVVPLAASAGAAFVLWLVFRLLLRSPGRAGLIVTTLLVLFFLFGHASAWLRDSLTWFRDWQLGVAFGAVFAVTCVLVGRMRTEPVGWTVALDVAAGALFLFNAALSVPGLVRASGLRERPARAAGGESGPDIYFIVLDGYGRSDILREVYGYDNSWFLDSLRRRGFYVAGRSRASYGQTLLSLGSSLNMVHLDSLAAAAGPESEDRGPLIELLFHNRVMRELRGRGFRVAAFASGYSGTEFTGADRYLAPPGVPTEFANLLLGTTPLGVLLPLVTGRSQFDLHRARAEYIFKHLPETGGGPSPTFTFAHILLPHPPFVYDSLGRPASPAGPFHLGDGNHFHHSEDDQRERYVAGYRGQVAAVSQRILGVIDSIVARSRRPPVIVLEGDHGPGALLNQDDPRWTYFPERLGILYAVLMPDRDYAGWYDSITPVNTFRLVFNRLFSESLAMQPDRSWFATWSLPYTYYDIDTYEQSGMTVPERAAVVAFRQARTPPPAPDYYWRELVHRKLPGAQVGRTFFFLVRRLPTAEEAYRRYRDAVARGELPELGTEHELFRGNHGSDWKPVVALLFADEERSPGRFAVVVFRPRPEPPANPADYLTRLVAMKHPSAAGSTMFVTQSAATSAEDAYREYRDAVAAGEMDDFGTSFDSYVGPDPEGVKAVVLFLPVADSAGPAQRNP